jgi:hypothetical protein
METERKTLRKVGKKEIKAEEDEDEDDEDEDSDDQLDSDDEDEDDDDEAIGEPTHASSN